MKQIRELIKKVALPDVMDFRIEAVISMMLLTAGLFWAKHHLWKFWPITIDDAYITFTYAKNLANGSGAVFSEGNRTEATSSLLWALLLTPFELVGVGSVLGGKLLGVICLIISLVLVYLTVETRTPSGQPCHGVLRPSISGVLFTLGSSAFLSWILQGMENPLVAMLIILSVHLFCREIENGRGMFSVLPVFLLEIARPEGIFFCALFLGYRIFSHFFYDSTTTKNLFQWALVLILCATFYEGWGLMYCGEFFPNTVGAKVSGISYGQVLKGVDYLMSASGLQVLIAFAIIGPIIIGLVILRRFFLQHPLSNHVLTLGILIIGMQILFSLLTGGDWMPAARFLSHLGPLLGATTGLTLVEFDQLARSKQISRRSAKIIQFLAVFAILGYYAGGFHALHRETPIATWIQENSERAINPMIEVVNQRSRATDVLAASDIGRLGYFYKGNIFDWWGLASRVVVQRGEALGRIKVKTVLEQHPKFVILYLGGPKLHHADAFRGFGGMTKRFLENEQFKKKITIY